jgi:hypothetical protein
MRSNQIIVQRSGTFGDIGLTQEGWPARRRPSCLIHPPISANRSLTRAALAERAERAMPKEHTPSSVVAVVSAVLAIFGALGTLYLPILLR